MNKQDKLKAIRAYCKAQGATFKRSNHYLNNVLAWHIVSRTTGETLARNMTIDNAYDAIESGTIKNMGTKVPFLFPYL